MKKEQYVDDFTHLAKNALDKHYSKLNKLSSPEQKTEAESKYVAFIHNKIEALMIGAESDSEIGSDTYNLRNALTMKANSFIQAYKEKLEK